MTSLLHFAHDEDDAHNINKDLSSDDPMIAKLLKFNKLENDLWNEYYNSDKKVKNWKQYISTDLHHSDHKKLDHLKKHPVFKDSFDWNNILLAGGFFTANEDDIKTTDIDLFIYGLEEEDAIKRLEKLAEHIFKCKYNGRIKVIRTKYAVTFIFDTDVNPIQVVLNLCRDPLEVLLSFDIAPSKIGFDGNTIICIDTSKTFIGRKYVITPDDLNRASKALGNRIEKYKKRGFIPISFVGEIPIIDMPSGYHGTDVEIDKATGKKVDFFTDRAIRSYVKKPSFVPIIYKKGNYNLSTGYSILFHSMGFVWYFLNHPMEYIDFIQRNHTCIKEILPKPEITEPIKFMKCRVFIDYINNIDTNFLVNKCQA